MEEMNEEQSFLPQILWEVNFYIKHLAISVVNNRLSNIKMKYYYSILK